MSPPRRIQLPPDALAKLQKERAEFIDGYLGQVGNITTIRNQAMDLVLTGALADVLVPDSDEDQQALVDRCARMAEKISTERIKRYNEEVLVVCKHLNVHDLPDFITWAAKRYGGVDLPVTLSEEPTKLLTEH